MSEIGLARLERHWQRGKEFLGSEYAILGGAMTWVSERNLVSAISNAGGFGVIACGGMGPDLLAAEIAATRKLTDKPFGVNLITLHPDLDALIDVCAEQKVSHVVLAGGLPSGASIAKIKGFGAKLMCFAPTAALAKKLVRSGVDAIIIEGAEAGGHIGPVSTSVLAQEILPVITDVPVFVAGGIGRGEVMASYLEMGASGAQLGTRFVVAEECVAHENFKKAFVRASARDAVASTQIDSRFPVIPVRALKNQGTEDFMKTQQEVVAKFRAGEIAQDEGQMMIEHFWGGALRRAVVDGDVETGSVMAGQSVGMVKKIEPTADIIRELVDQAIAHLDARG
ncbi:NAD(P)H-dependent flavin oxidoreductase [Kordiimonas lipolytica]|uniref:NAD(P)H-dependent flavin oxidoreductase n=1 Tax=Kordiimonas lipolytica TaxID=1662421 RepID=A0ABV8U6Z1_9PROT|nr:nitronate monooxygenase [Kordiimonas lipolytica]